MKKNIAVIIITLLCPLISVSLTAQKAYQELAVKRLLLSSHSQHLTAPDKHYLTQLFALTDRAVVARVQLQLWLNSEGKSGYNFAKYQKNINQIRQQLTTLKTPKHFRAINDLINRALSEQVTYFSSINQHPTNIAQIIQLEDKLAQHSHQRLQQAQQKLYHYFSATDHSLRAVIHAHFLALDIL